MTPCLHPREKIDWDETAAPGGPVNGLVDWFGTCECGQRLVEQYRSQGYGTVSEDGTYSFIGE